MKHAPRSIAGTDAAIIWREAELIAEYGWRWEDDSPRLDSNLAPSLVSAACWSAHGSRCQPRDLSPAEARRVAAALDILEEHWGMSVPEYESWCACEHKTAQDLAWDLACVAADLLGDPVPK